MRAVPSSSSESSAAAAARSAPTAAPKAAPTCSPGPSAVSSSSSGCSAFRPALSTKYTSESCSSTELSASHIGSHSGVPGERGSSSCTSSNTGSSEAGRSRLERSRTSSSWARPNGSMDIHTCCFVCFSSRSNGGSSCSVCTESVIGPVGVPSLSPNCLEACSGSCSGVKPTIRPAVSVRSDRQFGHGVQGHEGNACGNHSSFQISTSSTHEVTCTVHGLRTHASLA